MDTHILNSKAKSLDVPIQLEVAGRIQSPVQASGIGGHGDKVRADIPTETVRGVLGMIGRAHGDLTAGKGAIGDAATSEAAGNGNNGLPIGREPRDVGNVGAVTAEAVGGVEDGRIEDCCFAYGVEGPVPVSGYG
jgi:hypothetical protein